MSGLLLRLGAPLQSWGTHSTWNERDTELFPTRSGLIGMLAAALGIPRGGDLSALRSLRLLVRIDRPGHHLVDYHTVGGGRTRKQTVPTAKGDYRQQGMGTIVTNRHYLADAVFTVGITGPNLKVLSDVDNALRSPNWSPFLGRRSCPPDGPLMLGFVSDPSEWLHEKLPLARKAPADNETEVRIDFVSDEKPAGHTGWTESLTDDPESFENLKRVYRNRPAYRYRHDLPAELCAGSGPEYIDALNAALRGDG
ncbi:type I-E CRISPR-associated protein Cas5/CasD [Actinopolyspora erythraea]|uniref:Type I-E CRISPR-associated protein Cas5/CasD n=1 Tax=Actinopolyspora erythraea TaxID=414996 RepID=A0A099D0B1_9ACTN|nr:type I-E CRISPR-associated protein Cas5/CasD [Actinopolyspora erythraea]ASU79838.1 type I-E CRISPR-associated protein Cas5/CasD [Actinopolyspora erythraea]KGI79643.1 hypothetical protein IL38_22075 [Actinopolyspora erythraea]